MASVQATDEGDNDTDYDAGEDDDSGEMTPYTYTRHTQNRHGAQIGHHETVMTPRAAILGSVDILRAPSANGTIIATDEVFELPPTVTSRARLGNRTNGIASEARLPVEDTHPSSMSTTPSPPLQPTPQPGSSNGRPRTRGFGQDLIIEPPSPAPPPQLATYHPRPTMFSSPMHQDMRSSSKASDAGSAHSSGTNNTNASNGASYFRTYQNRAGQAGEAGSGGMYTPDLVFAEIGHGRGREGREIVAGPGPSTMMQAAWRSESDTSSPNDEQPPTTNGDLTARFESDLSLRGPVQEKRVNDADRGRQQVLPDTFHPLYRHGLTSSHETLPWATRLDQHDPSSPIPYISASPTTRELHESVQAALSGSRPGSSSASSSAQLSSEETMLDGRGRSVKRSFRNTLSAAEQYASALFFGRNGSSGASSSTSNRDPGVQLGGGSSTTVANNRRHSDRH